MVYCDSEAIEPFKSAHMSMSNIYKVFDNLHMLWMCIWMSPSNVTVALVCEAFGNFIESCLPPDGQTTTYCGG